MENTKILNFYKNSSLFTDLGLYANFAIERKIEDKKNIQRKQNLRSWAWGTGEMAQRLRALCSYRGPGFNSQHPHGSSQLSITPVPHAGKTPRHIRKNK